MFRSHTADSAPSDTGGDTELVLGQFIDGLTII